MSVREVSPLFSWGLSLRKSKWLIPLFNNNIFSFGNSAVNGPYGYAFQTRSKSTTNKPTSSTITATITQSGPTTTTREHSTACGIVMEEPRPQLAGQHQTDVSHSQPQQQVPEPTRKPASKLKDLPDEEILRLLQQGTLAHYGLESALADSERAVKIRREYLATQMEPEHASSMVNLPFQHYDYNKVLGACCENVVGYVPIPIGLAGPILLDGKKYTLPMATTEGCLVASTHRGCKAISESGGAESVVLADGITRAPVVQMPSAKRAGDLKLWLDVPENYKLVEEQFNSTSRFARLISIKVAVAGRKAYLRFKCRTGDAMGMNMITKATTKAMDYLQNVFPDMDQISISGNFCTDKKPSAVNWIEGRGKSVVCEAVVKKEIVTRVLKTSVEELVDLNINKNLIGSIMAGSIGGFNAHASNIVTAIFLATGQDPAQNVESSNCITLMEKTRDGDLLISCTMPSIEVGTVGGGTHLDAQSACLSIIGVNGTHPENPGQNATTLARVVCAGVMAGELSLMSALAANHLLRSHLALNRKAESPKTTA